ncbi:hypothetical protein JCGZ_23145 [Jatropha curcas]|uniref:F-box domain-containing protein n=1 Tax=Jatropha curcas TaxID=180498 RepID=A0A067JHH8_JATCU|nr:putative F-box protein PP2-B12 [Jatropha curcas]KDP23312.1 hypothetical protein JCGZ_23145 [Jatropha curcas]
MEEKRGGDLCVLPEGCIANVLSFTGPRDVGRLSVLSSTFRSAAESDAVWESFLPPEYQSIISGSPDSSLLVCSPSKKDIYLRLCDNPILIDGGKKSFQLDKWSGKKCFMISARDLLIVWGDTPRYWRWTSELDSRFAEVAELIGVCWLEIRGKINVCMLSTNTLYGVYLVYKTTAGAYGFERQPVVVKVGGHKRSVYLDAETESQLPYPTVGRHTGGLFINRRALGLQGPVATRDRDSNNPQGGEDGSLGAGRERQQRYRSMGRLPSGLYIRSRGVGLQVPVETREREFNSPQEREDGWSDRLFNRSPASGERDVNNSQEREDGWLEIELGEYFNKEGDDGELEISIEEMEGGHWKGGLIVQGIEIRPKESKMKRNKLKSSEKPIF